VKFAIALVTIGLSGACLAQAPDSRFEGIWVGTETVTLQQAKWGSKGPERGLFFKPFFGCRRLALQRTRPEQRFAFSSQLRFGDLLNLTQGVSACIAVDLNLSLRKHDFGVMLIFIKRVSGEIAFHTGIMGAAIS